MAPRVHRPEAGSSPRWPATASGPGGAEVVRLLTINVWSGDTYAIEPKGANLLKQLMLGHFGSHETPFPGRTEARFQQLCCHLELLKPDVIVINEATPSEAFSRRLAEALGFGFTSSCGLEILRVGPLKLPPHGIDEGDAILFHPSFECTGTVRQRLTGAVYSRWLSFNFDDATQALGCCLSRNACSIFCVGTHWRSSPIKGAYAKASGTKDDVEALLSAGVLTAEQVDIAVNIIDKGTHGRTAEAVISSRMALEGAARHGCDAAVLMGDLNTYGNTPEIEEVTSHGFVDTFGYFRRTVHQKGSSGKEEEEEEEEEGLGATWLPSANPNIKLQFAKSGADYVTGSSAASTSALGGASDSTIVEQRMMHLLEQEPARLDYVFVKGCSGALQPKVVSSEVVMDRSLPSSSVKGLLPSDHFGVLTTVMMQPKATPKL